MKLTTIFTAIAFIAFVTLGVKNITQSQQKLELKRIQLKDTSLQLKQLNQKYDNELQQKNVNEDYIKRLQQEKSDLEKQLQARRDEQSRLASLNAQTKVYAATVPKTAVGASVSVSGTCLDWINGAGIAEVASAQELIRRESGCNPNAVNRSSSACGVAQELPCGKSGCKLGDGACQVRWMDGYVKGRYGTWGNALAYHSAHNWY